MGGSAPRVNLKAEDRNTELEEERGKFENEKRMFVERAAANELTSSELLRGQGYSFEFLDFDQSRNLASVQIPARFDPSFSPRAGETAPSWFSGAHLGLNYTPPAFVPPPVTNTGTKPRRRYLMGG